MQVPASVEGEAAEGEGVLGAAGAASAAPEQAPAHPPAPERVEQQLEQQLEQQPEVAIETKPRVMARFNGSVKLFAGTVVGVNEDETFKVSFDDGDYDGNVPRASVCRMTAADELRAEKARIARHAAMQAVVRARALSCEK